MHTEFEIVRKAKMFAANSHAHQKYGEMPYLYHLDYVVNVLKRYDYTDTAITAAAWLHDTLEDTDITRQALAHEFGGEISDIVFAVTSAVGRNRSERMKNTAQKILVNKKALIVKLADRIANTEFSQTTNQKLYKMYLKEFPLFKSLLYKHSDTDLFPMWHCLIRLSS